MSEAFGQYSEALKARRAGIESQLGASATFTELKPELYADARILSEDALQVFDALKNDFPPYGLVDRKGSPVQGFNKSSRPWMQVFDALTETGRYVFDQTIPSNSGCPYHETLKQPSATGRIKLAPFDHDKFGLDTLRNVVATGSVQNAPLFASLAQRLPALHKLHGSTTDLETFARNSKSLLREPLSHPVQWAAPFVYTLGTISDFFSDNYLDDNVARSYTRLEKLQNGEERLAWAMPTAEFTVKQAVKVVDRSQGIWEAKDGTNVTTYPAGTKLKDIAITEQTIGCPGDQLARAMWDRTIDIAVGEGLWEA